MSGKVYHTFSKRQALLQTGWDAYCLRARLITTEQLEQRYAGQINAHTAEHVLGDTSFFCSFRTDWKTMKTDEARSKAFVRIATQLAKDPEGRKVRLPKLIDLLVKFNWHPPQQKLLDAIINDDPSSMPTLHTNLSWPEFTHPRNSNRLVSRGKGDSYDENAENLREKAPTLQACALAMGEEGPRALLYRYGGQLTRAFAHGLREFDFSQWAYRSWRYVDDEVVAQSLVAAVKKDQERIDAGVQEAAVNASTSSSSAWAATAGLASTATTSASTATTSRTSASSLPPTTTLAVGQPATLPFRPG